MPNWVDNVMIIKADPSTLSELRTKIKTDERDDTQQYFQIARSLYPMPQDLKYVVGSDRNSLMYAKVHNKVVMPPSDMEILSRQAGHDMFIGKSEKFKDTEYELVDLTEGEKKQLEEKHGATNWYDWNIKNYGSKWPDCYTHAQTVQNGNLLFQFESAWAPLVKLAQRISEDYKCKVVLKYSSIENCDKGELRFDSGMTYYDRWEFWDVQGMLLEEE